MNLISAWVVGVWWGEKSTLEARLVWGLALTMMAPAARTVELLVVVQMLSLRVQACRKGLCT